MRYHDLVEGVFEVGDATIRTQYLNHPALTLGYRIEADGATRRVRLRPRAPRRGPRRRRPAAAGQRRRPPRGLPRRRRRRDARHAVRRRRLRRRRSAGATARWSTPSAWPRAAGVRRLVLFHHDPQRDDDGVDALLDARARWRPPTAADLEVDAAAEGAVIEVSRAAVGHERRRRARRATAVPPSSDLAVGVASPRATRSSRRRSRRGRHRRGAARCGRSRGDLADAVVVLDVDDDSARASVDGMRRACSASPAGPIPAVRAAGITDWIVLPCIDRPHPHQAPRRGAPAGMPVAGGACRRPTKSIDSRRCIASACSTRRARSASTGSSSRPARSPTTPIALVTLVDADRQWFKATAGLDAIESHRDESFCAHAILGRRCPSGPGRAGGPEVRRQPGRGRPGSGSGSTPVCRWPSPTEAGSGPCASPTTALACSTTASSTRSAASRTSSSRSCRTTP